MPPDYQQKARQVVTVADLLEFLKIDVWDHLLVGDGSGSNWQHPGGWATAVITRATPALEVVSPIIEWFYGSTTHATNNTMEMMAYIEPLLWLLGQDQEIRYRKVHIVTDSQYLVWSATHANRWKANKLLWQLLHACQRFGVELTWHWVPRACISFNRMADNLAGLSRLTNVALKDELPEMENRFLRGPAPEPKPRTKKTKVKASKQVTA